ncbi:MAG: hypothetical protein ABIT07_06880 [Ferruginibacter sp.]
MQPLQSSVSISFGCMVSNVLLENTGFFGNIKRSLHWLFSIVEVPTERTQYLKDNVPKQEFSAIQDGKSKNMC